MIRKLTQQQIDQIFREGGTGTLPRSDAKGSGLRGPQRSPVSVTPFDFVQPPRISRARRNACEAVFTRFAASLASWLSLRVGTTEISVSGVEQVGFSELLLAIGKPSATFPFRSGSWHGLCDLSCDIAVAYVDRVLGGPAEVSTTARPLSHIEERIVRGLVERIVQTLRDTWQNDAPMNPEITGFESDPEEIDTIPRGEDVLASLFEIRFGGTSGILTVCLPLHAMDAFLQERKGSAKNTGTQATGSDKDRSEAALAVMDGLSHASLSVSARFPACRLSARSLIGLKEGSVIEIGHPVDSPLEILVNGQLRYLASMGQRRRRMALRIIEAASVPESERPERVREGRVS
jgi:flagellar motor switch protein FliM